MSGIGPGHWQRREGSGVLKVLISTTETNADFSSPSVVERNMMYRPSGLRACQLIGRPLVRGDWCPAECCQAGTPPDVQDAVNRGEPRTTTTRDRSGGQNFAPKRKVGLSKAYGGGIPGLTSGLIVFARTVEKLCDAPEDRQSLAGPPIKGSKITHFFTNCAFPQTMLAAVSEP